MTETDSIIDAIARELVMGDDRLMFRRAVRRHLAEIERLRVGGLDWRQIAQKLTARGARHKRGQPISAHQLRTEVARLKRSRGIAIVDPPTISRKNDGVSTAVTTPSYSDGRRDAGVLNRLAALTRTRVHGQGVND